MYGSQISSYGKTLAYIISKIEKGRKKKLVVCFQRANNFEKPSS